MGAICTLDSTAAGKTSAGRLTLHQKSDEKSLILMVSLLTTPYHAQRCNKALSQMATKWWTWWASVHGAMNASLHTTKTRFYITPCRSEHLSAQRITLMRMRDLRAIVLTFTVRMIEETLLSSQSKSTTTLTTIDRELPKTHLLCNPLMKYLWKTTRMI